MRSPVLPVILQLVVSNWVVSVNVRSWVETLNVDVTLIATLLSGCRMVAPSRSVTDASAAASPDTKTIAIVTSNSFGGFSSEQFIESHQHRYLQILLKLP